MSTILKIFILGFVSIQCLATEPYGLSGVWVGQGIMIIKDQNITEKCNMNLEIDHQPGYFKVIKSEFKCGVMNIRNKDKAPLKIMNNEIYIGDKVIGTVSAEHLASFLKLADGREQMYKMQLSAHRNQLMYFDRVQWTDVFETTIQGPLSRQLLQNNESQ